MELSEIPSSTFISHLSLRRRNALVIRKLWVGLMLTYQPFFIQGLDDVTGVEGKKTAFQTMFLFLATLLTSIGYLVYDKERIRREAAYEAVDNFDFTLPRGMTDYVVREIELT